MTATIILLACLAADDPPTVAWRFESAQGLCHFLVHEGKVFVGDDNGAMHALDAKTGAVLWKTVTGERAYYRPATDGERLFVAGNRTKIMALSVADGSVLWQRAIDKGVGHCVHHRERGWVFTAGHDGFVYAIDAKTGDTIWRTDIVEMAPPPPVDPKNAKSADERARPVGMAFDADRLYVSVFDQCRVVVLDLATGHERSSFQTGGWIWSTPLLSDEDYLIGSQDKSFYCVNKASSAVRWKHTAGSRIEADAAADEKSVFIGSCDGVFHCLDRQTGAVKWKLPSVPAEGRTRAIYASPWLDGHLVYLAAMEGTLYALDRADGKEIWKLRVEPESELADGVFADAENIYLSTRKRGKELGIDSVVALKRPRP